MREEFTMAKRYAKHSEAFREEAIRQARASSEPITKVARELGVHPRTLYLWVSEAKKAEATPTPEDERSEVRRLRRELRDVRMERDILKKAMAFFAKHTR
jgi:transposase